MTFNRFIPLAAAAIAALASFSEADAQTCRVTAGITADGKRSYLEVYEYDYVESKPQFPGGDSRLVAFINETRRYPAKAYREGVEGRVTCSFVVNTDGSVSHITVLKGVESSLNKEAVRIFSKMPDWQPGKISGHTVPVRVVWAIPFRK